MATDARQLGAGGALQLVEAEAEVERLRAELAALATVATAVAAGLLDTLPPGPGRHVVELAAQQLRTAAEAARRG